MEVTSVHEFPQTRPWNFPQTLHFFLNFRAVGFLFVDRRQSTLLAKDIHLSQKWTVRVLTTPRNCLNFHWKFKNYVKTVWRPENLPMPHIANFWWELLYYLKMVKIKYFLVHTYTEMMTKFVLQSFIHKWNNRKYM